MLEFPACGPVGQARAELSAIVRQALDRAVAEGALPAPQSELPEFLIEIPAERSHGDFACNVAMAGARALRRPPQVIAQAICARLDLLGTHFSHAEIAGPGFLNFFVSDKWYGDVLMRVLREGENYGRTSFGKNEKVMVEFVSANPTGPMHMGNARGGALGDGLAAALDWAGFDVTREFYINDAGNLIEKFGL
jgi:arginyl-tRNA synthetase